MIFEKQNDIFTARDALKRKDGEQKWVLLISDIHYDSAKCDRKLLKKHLDQAKEKDADILMFGDILDMMGGKFDPRSSKADIRPEYQVKDYFDAVVRDAYKFFEPYKENIKFISYGNHEASVIKRQEIDPLKNLASMLGCELGSYQGFIRFSFYRNDKLSSIVGTKLLYYTHGSGGSAPVTRGVIKTNRRNATIQSDIFVSGHIHNEWVVNVPMVKVSQGGNIKKTDQTHISLGTYKDDSFSGGWADMKEFPPPSMGGCWVRFYFDLQKDDVSYETIRAI